MFMRKVLSVDTKVFLPLLMSIIIIAALFIAITIYNNNQVKPEEITSGLSEFYKNDYYNILEYQKDHYCDIEMKIWTSNKSVLINSHCTAEYPYSALEAFIAVARGNIENNESVYQTNLDWSMSEEEAFGHKLQLIQYPLVSVSLNGTTEAVAPYLCFTPCLDNNPPDSFNVTSVKYSPDRKQVSNLFRNYSLDNFRGLNFKSDYSYTLFYKSMENVLEWRYLVGQADIGKFRLSIETDKPPSTLKNEREDIRTLFEIPEEEYNIDKISENEYVVSGSATGIDKLVIEW